MLVTPNSPWSLLGLLCSSFMTDNWPMVSTLPISRTASSGRRPIFKLQASTCLFASPSRAQAAFRTSVDYETNSPAFNLTLGSSLDAFFRLRAPDCA
jgi:hypothetical protein